MQKGRLTQRGSIGWGGGGRQRAYQPWKFGPRGLARLVQELGLQLTHGWHLACSVEEGSVHWGS